MIATSGTSSVRVRTARSAASIIRLACPPAPPAPRAGARAAPGIRRRTAGIAAAPRRPVAPGRPSPRASRRGCAAPRPPPRARSPAPPAALPRGSLPAAAAGSDPRGSAAGGAGDRARGGGRGAAHPRRDARGEGRPGATGRRGAAAIPAVRRRIPGAARAPARGAGGAGGQARRMIDAALRAVRTRTELVPDVAIILGTGLGGLADEVRVEARIPYGAIPGFPLSTVESHAGQLLVGSLAGRRVGAMPGRFHRYEGHTAPQNSLPVRPLPPPGPANPCVSQPPHRPPP